MRNSIENFDIKGVYKSLIKFSFISIIIMLCIITDIYLRYYAVDEIKYNILRDSWVGGFYTYLFFTIFLIANYLLNRKNFVKNYSLNVKLLKKLYRYCALFTIIGIPAFLYICIDVNSVIRNYINDAFGYGCAGGFYACLFFAIFFIYSYLSYSKKLNLKD